MVAEAVAGTFARAGKRVWLPVVAPLPVGPPSAGAAAVAAASAHPGPPAGGGSRCEAGVPSGAILPPQAGGWSDDRPPRSKGIRSAVVSPFPTG